MLKLHHLKTLFWTNLMSNISTKSSKKHQFNIPISTFLQIRYKFNTHFSFISIQVRSSIPLELNKWYNIRLDRTDMIGGITLDGTPVARNGVEGAPAVFQMMTNMYIGGRPDLVDVVGYSGCIDEVRIEPDLVELQKNLDSKNFAASCTMEVIVYSTLL